MTAIFAWSKLFEPIRPDWYFFHCPQCVGFWVGVFVSIFYPVVNIQGMTLVTVLFHGCLSSGTSYIIDKLFGDEGLNIKLGVSDDS